MIDEGLLESLPNVRDALATIAESGVIPSEIERRERIIIQSFNKTPQELQEMIHTTQLAVAQLLELHNLGLDYLALRKESANA